MRSLNKEMSARLKSEIFVKRLFTRMLTCHIEGLGLPNNTQIKRRILCPTPIHKYVEFQRTIPKPIVHRAKPQRFFGYKASGGVNEDKSIYSPMRLFYPLAIGSYKGYSSTA
jgi:hypothetical protein